MSSMKFPKRQVADAIAEDKTLDDTIAILDEMCDPDSSRGRNLTPLTRKIKYAEELRKFCRKTIGGKRGNPITRLGHLFSCNLNTSKSRSLKTNEMLP